ncbi:Adenine deaminase [Quillaja saponaria]|uniref:Adenine deaminase n=1 Tax=Quillaja saponaria TaxID=32244 RepID=A0AAD7KUK6_QUISA|nr:Adenine deaminase [Quillaja saponaria]
MAVNSSIEGESHIREFMDKNCSLPASCSSFKLLKASVEDINQHFSSETLPILIEETSFPAELDCSFHCSPSQDVYSISVLPDENCNPQCASPLDFLSILEVPDLTNNQMYLDSPLNCQSYIDFQMTSQELYSPCIVDIPTESKYSKPPESNEDAGERFKSESVLIHLHRVLTKQASLIVGGRLMQLLMNFSTSRDKSVTERVHDMPNNKWRRYKRAALFDSRNIAVLFSILSSLGTLVLIYLTLRVRQKGDASVLI